MSNEHESSAGLGKIARDPDDDLKEALHELPYGMYVIGSSDGATPNAMIADWVMQVSFNPRLISVSSRSILRLLLVSENINSSL